MDLLPFLITAKKATYAAQGDAATTTPLLNGSRQLEYREGDLLYRDIYFGMSFFIGQETVYLQGNPIWSMAYSGGVPEKNDIDFVREVYVFLRKALREVSFEFPYRGPCELKDGNFVYQNQQQGHFGQFSGRESILFKNSEVYSLNYSGGLIR